LKGARPDFAGARAQHVALAERQIGILVDAVSDILTIAPREMLPVPEMNGGMIQSFLSGLVSREDHLVALLRLEDLFAIGDLSAPRHSWMGPAAVKGRPEPGLTIIRSWIGWQNWVDQRSFSTPDGALYVAANVLGGRKPTLRPSRISHYWRTPMSIGRKGRLLASLTFLYQRRSLPLARSW
jgi:hypothetical protein